MILFSHIPLFRPDVASCGPLRERGTIRRGVGHGYQNTLGKHTTEFLLESVRPVLVFRYALFLDVTRKIIVKIVSFYLNCQRR